MHCNGTTGAVGVELDAAAHVGGVGSLIGVAQAVRINQLEVRRVLSAAVSVSFLRETALWTAFFKTPTFSMQMNFSSIFLFLSNRSRSRQTRYIQPGARTVESRRALSGSAKSRSSSRLASIIGSPHLKLLPNHLR